MRLDIYVVSQLSQVPRTYARRLIDAGKVLVNGKTAKASYHLKPKDKIKINKDDKKVKIPKIKIPIIYEDDDCVVIDKPAGLLTHSKGAFIPEATVATWLIDKYKLDNTNNRDGIVHRLDRATSGVMICAKNDEALSWLQKQFSTRKVKKNYIAVIEGELNPPAAVIDMPIGRNPKSPQKFRVDASGKSAVTEYKTLKNLQINEKVFSVVELKPTTGRTHQLRVHLAHQKHPILGDSFYGGKQANRLYLHAEQLELTLPNKERQVFKSRLPKDFKAPQL